MWSEQGTHTRKHMWLHSHLKICTFLHFSLFSSTIYLSIYIFQFFSWYILQFSFIFFLLLRSKFLFISFACCARARVFGLKGRRVSVFFKICACNFSRRVCHYSKHTHSPIHTPHGKEEWWRETHLRTICIYIHYILVYLFFLFFLNWFIIYQWWITTEDDPHLLKHKCFFCFYFLLKK